MATRKPRKTQKKRATSGKSSRPGRTYVRKTGRRRSKKVSGRRAVLSPFLRLMTELGVFAMTALVGVAAVFAYFASDLPDTAGLWREAEAPKITLLAADGAPIMRQGISQGAPIRLASLPSHVSDAVLAVEDRNFYHHLGANPVSIVRALIVNANQGAVRQGGSTITQQLAKNVFLSGEQTMKRKIQELMLAFWLEQKFTKEEILTLYLNRVYFGAGAYGIDAASYRYFGKPARDLVLGEAAILAGLLKAPSRYAPTSNPADAGKRGRLVLEQMVTAGFISREKADRAIAHPVLLVKPRFESAPYFVDHVLREARALTADIDADLIIHTTFDPMVQAAAETGLIAGVASSDDDLEGVEVAAVILDRDGAVRAMIGGRDYGKSQFNRATQAQRQPGSAFKPVIYVSALMNGAYPDEVVLDAPITVGNWTPGNYKEKYFGEVSLREAMARSLNSAAIRVQEQTGRANVRAMARDLGWTGKLTTGPSLALGVDAVSPLALAGVYVPFANQGFRVEPHVITRIETAEGDVVFQRAGVLLDEAASAHAIGMTNDMLRSVTAWGTGRAAAIPGYEVAGKTGTSQQNRDAWFAGHAGGLVGVVWIGHDNNQPMQGVTGGRAPAIIWREMLARALPPPTYVRPVREEDPIAALLQAGG